MPKLPILSGKDIIKILERMGFDNVRQKGSHVVMKKGSVGCVVPMHKEVAIGTLHGILRQANISPEDFMNNI
jgi:predicted RNA binding protein YcfA (HicA-like mRNA interferase family)